MEGRLRGLDVGWYGGGDDILGELDRGCVKERVVGKNSRALVVMQFQAMRNYSQLVRLGIIVQG